MASNSHTHHATIGVFSGWQVGRTSKIFFHFSVARIVLVIVAILTFAASCKKNKDSKGLPSLTTTEITNATSTGIITGGNIVSDGGSVISKRGVCWAAHATPTVADSITNDGGGAGSFTSTIGNLNSNTTYYIRAYAVNASGTAYGNELTFTTAKGVPTVSTAAINDIQPLSAKTGGEVLNDGGAEVTERGVVYSTSPNPIISDNKITAGAGTGVFSSTLSPLASQQTYYVRAYATNSFGTAYGNQVQFTAASANTVTDIDGNVYPYITLCDGKSWMAINLKTTRYKNGDPITNGVSGFTWEGTSTAAYTFPNGDITKKDSLGLLYNEYVVANTNGVCPTGWHIPNDAEWQAVEICNGLDPAVAGTNGGRGTIGAKFLLGGSTGMNIKGAGYFLYSVPPFSYVEYGLSGCGAFWTSTPSPVVPNGFRSRTFNSENDPAPIHRGNSGTVALSIRCVKD